MTFNDYDASQCNLQYIIVIKLMCAILLQLILQMVVTAILTVTDTHGELLLEYQIYMPQKVGSHLLILQNSVQ